MTAEAERSWQQDPATLRARAMRMGRAGLYWLKRLSRWLGQHRPFRHGFSSLTRRIVVLNLIGLAILVSGILYLNQFRAGLIDARVQSLQTQGEIIARAIAASAGVDATRPRSMRKRFWRKSSTRRAFPPAMRCRPRSGSPSIPNGPRRSCGPW